MRGRESRRGRRGSAAVLMASLLVVLVGAGAVAVDIGYQRVVGEQLQAGLDAAAIAASNRLDVSPEAARTAAVSMASLNVAGDHAIEIIDDDVEIGTWDATAGTFTVLSGAAESGGNAVRVSRNVNDVPTFMARAFGVGSLSVSRVAIAGTTGSGVAQCGVLASTNAQINGNWSADSYDSDTGSYADTQGSSAGVCSNGSVTANGHANVQGSVFYGRDSGDSASVSGSVTISGKVEKLPEEVVMPSADSSAARTSNDNASIPRTSSGKRALSGTSFSMNARDTLTLAAGTYYFTSFSLNGQAVLKVSGAVTIYVAGDVHANGGGILNQTSAPANLTVYVDGSRSVEVNGGADFYGSIIAPDSEAHLNGNADFYGILVAERVELNGNGAFHEDLAMIEDHVGTVEGNSRVVLFQ